MDVTLIILAAVLVAAFLRGLTGFGFSLAAVPVMSLVIDPARAVVIAILLQSFVGMRDIVTLRRQLDRQALALLSAGAVLGTPLGVLALTHLSADMMRVLIALVAGVGLVALLARVPLPDRPATAVGAGLLAGLFSGLAAMPGPPAIAYFLGVGRPAGTARASLMIFFFLTSLFALPGLLLAGRIDGGVFTQALIAFPALLIGTWAGGLAFRRLDEGGYRRAAIALLAVTALVTALRGIAGLV